ncbi:molybdopterin-dependent oxidoreductase [Actinomarinicola tropica]|uniref:Molybdopterin-dependent oxidoreductase n=1 Tax=Actinomarinicola tropica TaxID=2789776 RepID=A0A5Q2RJE7_9ACTN|nr:molybdopterin-dependent oxidoreductase [Actinomarinicola tropica]QGG95923.1 molybdopterin-dependent oxidoreductase [Actinomarinicola tropica]
METSTNDPARQARAAAAGLVAAALALATGELVAGFSVRFTSPVVAVGDAVIDRVPASVKDWAIDTFGTNDKVALVVGILVVAALAGGLLGILAARRPLAGAAGIVGFGVVGALAAVAEPDASGLAWIPSASAALVGAPAIAWLAPRSGVPADTRSDAAADSRRQFILGSTAMLAGAAIFGSTGRWLQGRASAVASRMAVVLPMPRRAAPPVPAGADLGLRGVEPWQTPISDFYRIDVNLVVPQVPAETWRLRVHGMVERELVLTYDELLAREMVEEDITLCCVSNEVGGDLIGTARWLGTRLDDLLAEAGVDPEADQVVGRSTDGFTVGFPVSVLDDGRPALVAVGMNGEPLPIRHGFPARLVVPGLYGYVSATKWLSEIELTRFDRFETYWIERNWAVEGPVKVMSRIDTPRDGATIARGRVAVAGVAWAQPVGVAAVEVRVDDGPWVEARLGEEVNRHTWRQWVHEWDATPGRHLLTVRATDHDGQTQTAERAAPVPSGATGWHQVVVEIG